MAAVKFWGAALLFWAFLVGLIYLLLRYGLGVVSPWPALLGGSILFIFTFWRGFKEGAFYLEEEET